MNFQDLKQKIENKEELQLDIKRYLPIIHKHMLVEDMLNSSIKTNENNMEYIDYVNYEFNFDLYIIKYYTDLELDLDEIIDEYDYLKYTNVIEYIFASIDSAELSSIKEMVSKSIEQQIKISNSLESVISRIAMQLIDKIPESGKIDKWIKEIATNIKDFTPDKFKKLNELFAFAKGE